MDESLSSHVEHELVHAAEYVRFSCGKGLYYKHEEAFFYVTRFW